MLYMNPLLNLNPDLLTTTFLTSLIYFVPRIIAALLVFIAGKILAKYLAHGLSKIILAINLKKTVDSFQLGLHIPEKSQEGIANIIGLLIRYAVLYVTLILCLDILGLTSVANFLKGLTVVLPKVFSALFILFLGIILAGLVESVVKKALAAFDPATARFSGKISSYVVVGFFVLMSLAELGVASFFINTLFIGFVATLALAFGLSLGLGSKDFVDKTLDKWSDTRNKKKLH